MPIATPIIASSIAESPVELWAEVLAHDLNHRSPPCLHGQVACQVFHSAKSVMKVYTRRKRREVFDWINELTSLLIQVWAVSTPRQAETARSLLMKSMLATRCG